MITERENGLLYLWHGLVWCNPPYGRKMMVWMERMALHNDGIALIFARTDTRAFHEHVWPIASSLLFLRGRLTFHRPTGEPAPEGHNSGGPSVLIGYGHEAARRLAACRDIGAFIEGRNTSRAGGIRADEHDQATTSGHHTHSPAAPAQVGAAGDIP